MALSVVGSKDDRNRFPRSAPRPGDYIRHPRGRTEGGVPSNPEKAEILRRWQYNIAEENVALEEGMQGSETGMMRRVMLALQQVVGDLEISRDGPSKQHGLRHSKGK